MLTLTRREGESIVIGDSIRVTVRAIKGRHVRIMISAPSGVPIYREELYEAIEAENRAAAQTQAQLPQQVRGLSVQLTTEVPSQKKKGKS
jgi:carbon storage regulator